VPPGVTPSDTPIPVNTVPPPPPTTDTPTPDPTVVGTNSTAAVGSRVWLDLDQDGVQDPEEGNVVGVTVSLYGSDGTLIDTVVTDANGEYFFTGLPAGDYYIEFDLPTGFSVTAQNAGASDADDSDVNPDTGRTEVFTLAVNEKNPTLDAGLYIAPSALDVGLEPGRYLEPTSLDTIAEPARLPYSLFLPAIGRTQFKSPPTQLSQYAQMYAEIACLMISDLESHGQTVPSKRCIRKDAPFLFTFIFVQRFHASSLF